MARGVRLTYTVDELRDAITRSKSWRGVMRELGYATTAGRLTVRLRNHAEELGINFSHFQGKSYTEDQLRQAVASSTTWAGVMTALGKTHGNGTAAARTVAERLDIDTSHFISKRSFRPVPGEVLPFGNDIRPGSQSGLSIAARWFLDRGYVVSVPLEPAPYDLVTESDDGLKRVQVKTTRRRASNGRYTAGIGRHVHDATAPRNANGNRRTVPYNVEDVDYFFVITPLKMYLIPIGIADSRCQLILDEKYAAFAV